MTNMFKKSLVALALAGVAATSAYANAAPSVQEYSVQGVNLEARIAIPSVVIETNTPYIGNDVIEVVVTGAAFDTSVAANFAPTLEETPGDLLTSFIDVKTGTTNTLRFRVNTDGIDAETELTLSGVQVVTGSFKAGDSISVASKAISLNPAIGEYDAQAARKVAEFKTQYALASVEAVFNEVINVDSDRKTFVGSGTTDTLEFTLSDAQSLQFAATTDKVVHVITGDFSNLVDEDGEALAFATATAVAAGGADTFAVELSEDADAVTITQTVVGDLDTDITVTFNVAGVAQEILAGSFAADIDVAYEKATDSTKKGSINLADNAAVGSWTLNGTTVSVPYMLYGANARQVVQVTNSSTKAGEVYGVAIIGEQRIDLGYLADLPANTVVNVTPELLAAVYDKTSVSATSSNTVVALELFVTLPSKVSAYTAYQRTNGTDNTRQIVLNTVTTPVN